MFQGKELWLCYIIYFEDFRTNRANWSNYGGRWPHVSPTGREFCLLACAFTGVSSQKNVKLPVMSKVRFWAIIKDSA
jgi:hypothetical protein